MGIADRGLHRDEATADRLRTWLIREGLRGVDRKSLLQSFCNQLVAAGLPLVRMQLVQRAFHPKFGGIGYTWTAEQGVIEQYFSRPDHTRQVWVQSPFYALIAKAEPEMSVCLLGPDGDRYPVFEDLKALDGRFYYANWQPLGHVDRCTCVPDALDTEGVLASWTFGGDNAADPAYRALIRGLFETLSMVLSSASNRDMGRDLLQVYLGRDAGERVMSGEISRGSSELIDAVICLFDLQGFTRMAEQIPGDDLVGMLNDYFGHVVDIVHAHGGNVLKFMGDGVMAMFNLGTLAEDAEAALAAVAALALRMEEVSAERQQNGLPVAKYTLALHAGEILYGNIGAENRLDFTVIGPAVNLTARLADMHRTVERSVILSENVRNAAPQAAETLVSLGRYMLRGVDAPIELFTIYHPDRCPT